jgi:hypothetical protein
MLVATSIKRVVDRRAMPSPAGLREGVTFSARERCSGVRLSPKSIFLGIVALGLPITVTIGWTFGDPPAGPSVPAPDGAGGIGGAPAQGTSVPSAAGGWSTASPRPVSVDTPAPVERSTVPLRVRPRITATDLPIPTLPAPPPQATQAAPTSAPTDPPTEGPPTPDPVETP